MVIIKRVLHLPRKPNWFIWFCVQKRVKTGENLWSIPLSTSNSPYPHFVKGKESLKLHQGLVKDLQSHFSDSSAKLRVWAFQKAIKFGMIWGSSRIDVGNFAHYLHAFLFSFSFFPIPSSHRWVLEAEPTQCPTASCGQLWWGVKRRCILLWLTRQMAHVWAGRQVWTSALTWAQLTAVPGDAAGLEYVQTMEKVFLLFFFPASRCFFCRALVEDSSQAGAHGKCMARMSAIASSLHFGKEWSLWTIHTHPRDKPLRLRPG